MNRPLSNLAGLTAFVAAIALAGCASKSKTPFDQPRLATVLEVTSPDTPEDKVRQSVSAARASVLTGLIRHQEQGGSLTPWSVGPAVGGMVGDARSAVAESCTQVLLLEFSDDQKRLGIKTRCHQAFNVGQKVSVVRAAQPAVDLRDILQVTPVQ
ncbi:hypothetical protein ACVNIS_04325 [Sphaerotilaceae bacterium SBD11-9]